MLAQPATRLFGLASGAYRDRVRAVAGANLLQYLILNDPVGAAAAADASGYERTGAYTNITLGQDGIGDGKTAASFNGTTSLVNAYSVSYRDAFNPNEGTVHLWCKVTDWSAPALSQNIFRNRTDTSNSVDINRPASANRINATYLAGGTSKACSITTISTLDWFSITFTWSKTADACNLYINGTQSGVTTPTQTTLGTWSGALVSGGVLFGVSTTAPANPWPGIMAHVVSISRPLNVSEVARIGTL